jgi:hypothetical protein
MNIGRRLSQLESRIFGRDEESAAQIATTARYAAALERVNPATHARLRELGARWQRQLHGDNSDPLTDSEHSELHRLVHSVQADARRSLRH